MDIFDGIFARIAQNHGISIQEVKLQIENLALEGLCSKDPNIRFFWKQIKKEGELPSAREILQHFCRLCLYTGMFNEKGRF